MIPRLGDDPGAPFPPPEEALPRPDGLLAWGGDLSRERLLRAYGQGIFPWYSEDEPILWWTPARRCVLRTANFHVSRRLGRLLRQGRIEVTADRDFPGVLAGCATARDGTWITPEMAVAFTELHRAGDAHSFEAWRDGELVGGLYGVALGRMFFGESMYSAADNASKVVMARLCAVLDDWGFSWMDCQVPSRHLYRLGAEMIPRERFLEGVRERTALPFASGSWTDRFADSQATS